MVLAFVHGVLAALNSTTAFAPSARGLTSVHSLIGLVPV